MSLSEKWKNDNSVYVIAEIGLNHNGSLSMAHDLIDVAAESKVSAVKFQKRTVSELAIRSSLEAPDNRFPSFGSTYGQIREFLEFDLREYSELKLHAEKLSLDFIVTPFDSLALKFLGNLNLNGYKIASHSVTNLDFIKDVAATGKSIIMSTGMSELAEVETAVSSITTINPDLTLLHCVSSYPTPNSDCNLKVISTLAEKFKLPIGYSGHEVEFLPTLIAVALGARVVERHITLDNSLNGFDHKLSLDPDSLKEMVVSIEAVREILGSDQKNLLPIEMIARNKYNVSMVSARDLAIGESLSEGDICWKNPGTGIPRKRMKDFIGRKLKVSVGIDELLTPEMFE
jgi:sialic acid synthase SpsE